VPSGSVGSVSFTGLTANTDYSVSATAQASGEAESSSSASTSYTTDKYTTAVPSWDSNGSITQTSAKVYYTNNDGSTATVYVTIGTSTKSVLIGAGSTGFVEFTGLTANTTYTSTAYAQASGENASASSQSTGTNFTTLEIAKEWSYIGTSGTNDGTVTFGSQDDVCRTAGDVEEDLLTPIYPASAYAVGFVMRVQHSVLIDIPPFDPYATDCTEFYYEVVEVT